MTSRNSEERVAANFHVVWVFFSLHARKKGQSLYEISDLRAVKSRWESDWSVALGRRKSQP